MDLARISERVERSNLAPKPARLDGYQLTFHKRPRDNKIASQGIGYAALIEAPGESVHGLLFELTEAELLRLDHHEGVHRGEHRREYVTVMLNDIDAVEAMVYRAPQDRIDPQRRPTRQYLGYLLAAESMLPPAYAARLRRQPCID